MANAVSKPVQYLLFVLYKVQVWIEFFIVAIFIDGRQYRILALRL